MNNFVILSKICIIYQIFIIFILLILILYIVHSLLIYYILINSKINLILYNISFFFSFLQIKLNFNNFKCVTRNIFLA